MSYSSRLCTKCQSNNKNEFADIYDFQCDLIVPALVQRRIADIIKYREKIMNEQTDDKNNDIPFQKVYRRFMTTVAHPLFISTIIHLDGIPLGKSNNLTLWLLSCSILELPPALRSQKENMIILSMWISTRSPIMKLWIRDCIENIKKLKSSGFSINNGEKWYFYILGLIGDCPALKLALHHIGNNGYYPCWFCKIEGVHVNTKRQYYYEETPILRTIDSYINESTEAELHNENVCGHLGLSCFMDILDVPFPISVLMDYMHVSLLRHTRCVVVQIYESLPPATRAEIDNKLISQQFPHTFHRKLKPIKAGHVKASEMKNLLFYALLPLFYECIPIDKAAHLALFVCAIRMLHGGKKYSNRTSSISNHLLNVYYKEHTKYYDGLANLVLHLHSHYAVQYENYGSLNNTNCFSQENLIGKFSKNKHGSRYWGELLAHYFSIDFALQNTINRQHIDHVKRVEGAFDMSSKSVNAIKHLITWHSSVYFFIMHCSASVVEGTRKRAPRVIFTPTQSVSAPSPYYLLFFDETESYQIVARSSIKKFDDQDSAIITINNKLFRGSIVASGTFDFCQKELSRRTRLSQDNINNDDTEIAELNYNTGNGKNMAEAQHSIRTQSHFQTASSITFDLPVSPEIDEADEEDQTLNSQVFYSNRQPTTTTTTTNAAKKRKSNVNITNEKRKRIDTNNLGQIRRMETASHATASDVSIVNLIHEGFSTLENNLRSIENKTDQKLAQLAKKVDYIASSSVSSKTSALDAYRDEHNEVFQKEVMHDEINLLTTNASSIGDFARKTMKIVFSEDKLKTHILPPKRKHLSRECLDPKLFARVNDAIRVEFKIDSVKYAAFYKNILRRKLSDFLIEERRRSSRRSIRSSADASTDEASPESN